MKKTITKEVEVDCCDICEKVLEERYWRVDRIKFLKDRVVGFTIEKDNSRVVCIQCARMFYREQAKVFNHFFPVNERKKITK